MPKKQPVGQDPEHLLLSVLETSEALTADELVARARKASADVSAFDVLSAAWHLVGQGKARFSEGKLLRAN